MVAAVACFVTNCLSGVGVCGTLSDFKNPPRVDNKPNPGPVRSDPERREGGHRDGRHDGYRNIHPDPSYGFVNHVFFYGMYYGGANSLGRIGGYDLEEGYRRQAGEVLIPFLRIDTSYQTIKSDVDAYNYSIEGGFGPVGVSLSRAHFRETDPDDSMDITSVYGLYRMSFGKTVEVDLGMGLFSIDDENESRFSVTMPVLIHPNDFIGIEIRPEWADGISQYDIGVLIGFPYVSLKAGYRWLSRYPRWDDDPAEPSKVLDGPYAGLSVHF